MAAINGGTNSIGRNELPEDLQEPTIPVQKQVSDTAALRLPTVGSAVDAETTGGVNSFQTGGLPIVLEPQVLKHCSLPILSALSATSHRSKETVTRFLALPGAPGIAHDALRRKRFQAELSKIASQDQCFEQCSKMIFNGLTWTAGTELASASNEQLDALTEKFAEAKLAHLWLRPDWLAPERSPDLIRAVSVAFPWQTLTLNLSSLGPDRFADHGAAMLKAIHYGTEDIRIKLTLGKHFSNQDAHALLAFLRTNPQCKSLEFSSDEESFPIHDGHTFLAFLDANPLSKTPAYSSVRPSLEGLNIFCAGLSSSNVDEISISGPLSDGQKESFRSLLAHPKLKHLAIKSVVLQSDGAALLADAIRGNSRLLSLALCHNQLTEQGTKDLAHAIAAHPRIERLYFAQSTIGSEGLNTLANTVAAHRTLTDIRIGNVEFRRAGQYEETSQLDFLTTISSCRKLLRVELFEFVASEKSIPLIKLLVDNNPHLSYLSLVRIRNEKLARDLANALLNARVPLQVRCVSNLTHLNVLKEQARANPLLSFVW